MSIPSFRTSFARKDQQAEIRDLRNAHRDPADLVQKVAKFQLWQARKKAGKLEAYTGTLRREV